MRSLKEPKDAVINKLHLSSWWFSHSNYTLLSCLSDLLRKVQLSDRTNVTEVNSWSSYKHSFLSTLPLLGEDTAGLETLLCMFYCCSFRSGIKRT